MPARAALPPTTAVALTAPLRTAFSRLASRLRLRAAVFLWIVFFDATRSSRWTTLRSSCSALVMSPLVRAVLKDLIWSLISSLRARLRARRLTVWRTRFLAEREWATFVRSCCCRGYSLVTRGYSFNIPAVA